MNDKQGQKQEKHKKNKVKDKYGQYDQGEGQDKEISMRKLATTSVLA